MKQPKNKKVKTMTANFAAKISSADAMTLAEKELDVFQYEPTKEYLTYEDIAQGENMAYTLKEIKEDMNEEMYVMTLDGTSPVFKKRKMFPR